MSDNFELDKGDDLIFAFDLSASMNRNDCPGNKPRLEFSKEKAIELVIEASAVDADGVPIIGFGEGAREIGLATKDNAESLIRPLKASEGGTDTHEAVDLAYSLHKKKGSKQTFLFLVTDGVPNDKEKLEQSIIKITNEIKDEHEFAIGLIIAGEPAQDVKDWLKELDDGLEKKGAKHDIVDVKYFAEVKNLVQIAAAALHD